MEKKRVVIGILGPSLDSGRVQGAGRWGKWRPSIDLCRHDDFIVDRFEFLYEKKFKKLAEVVKKDIQYISPETTIHSHPLSIADPWDFEQAYSGLLEFAQSYTFKPETEEYLIHITTGTHVIQICMFLLTESNYFPGKLLQTEPPAKKSGKNGVGGYQIIDLDLSKYDTIASRFQVEHREGISFLKSGIETKNKAFNTLMERIEYVAIRTKAPILLSGPTGAGKSQLGRKIYELKKSRLAVEGDFVEVNCATLRGDAAMSTLFGHKKGAFTGAIQDRQGLLRKADGGILFLDEIGELGADEQSMLLRALEEKSFLPVGSDVEVQSDFQLIAGTNRNLWQDVSTKRFRDDLLARINLWSFALPSLHERTEDIEPNLDYELDQYAKQAGTRVTFNKEARRAFVQFACSKEALWSGNFRDLSGAVTRMATLALGGRINNAVVREEILRLQQNWKTHEVDVVDHILVETLGLAGAENLDRFDRVQLADVLAVCRQSKSMSEAGRTLYSNSRTKKKNPNDADRLRKYLARFQLEWKDVG